MGGIHPKDGLSRLSLGLQTVLAAILLAIVWGSCLFQPTQFIVWILPMGVAAVVALGYGATQGTLRKSKAPQEVAAGYSDAPDWFKRGVDAALLAPTALNQQKFSFALAGETEAGAPLVRAMTRRGPFTQMDLGIAQCHFEIGAGDALFAWAD